VDCTTLTGQLFESQLFGHVKGAFTGAIHDTLGFFRAADGGTIFLDEISEIPPDLQAKLLRVLQEGIVTPIGSTRGYPINVRVLCAANRDLHDMVKKNEFRADLFYRINVVNLEIPPLRQRPDDILPLANHFLNNQALFYDEPAKKLSARSEQLLLKYHWPGNVREVANAMERAYVLSTAEIVDPSVLPKEIVASAYATQPGSPLPTLDDAQSKLIAEALHLTEGRKVATAKVLGIDRRRLNRLIEKLNIKVPKSGG
jgi:transcriptional regulator with PAS, ATPase and Fis domain